MNDQAPAVLSNCSQAALDLAAIGWDVFPLEFTPEGRKKSYASAEHSGGRRWGATTDPAELRKMFRRWPMAGVGIATGPGSGIFVLDVDTDEEHAADGFASLASLEEEHGPLPLTVTAESPSGGRHLYFRWPTDGAPVSTNAGKVAPGVDQRGEGGMIAAPPTVKPGRADPYRWIHPPGRVAVADAPDWLLALCRKPKLSERARARGPRLDAGPNAWAQAGLAGELAKVLAAPAGRRNEELNCAAYNLGQIVGGGSLDESDVRARLIGAGLAIGLEEAETQDTVASGMTAGMAQPRMPPENRERRGEWKEGAPEPGGAETTSEPGPMGEGELELTEDGVARAFTARFKGRLRFDHEAGAWFEWMGDHWRRDGTGLAFQFAREVARNLSSDGSQRDQATARKKGFAAGVEAFARVDRAHAVTQAAWDRDPFLLGVPGGVVDLRTGRLRPADPADGITKRAAVAPAAAECPLWLAFLHQATGGDLEVIAFLRRWLGYCLTGDTREHALIFVYGPGGNGKSVLLNTAARLMGDYATTAAMDTFTTSKGDKHPTELALLRGARMVTASETEEGRAWAEARIKQMTGGDPITARFMRQDFFTYQPQFKLTIVGNHAPALANVDDAARRRFNILPFVRKPTNPDRELETKLEAEWPAILRWMIDGAVEWLRDGLGQPESIRAATADYFSEQDVVARWLEERCTLTPANPTHFETAAELFASWSEFAKSAGEAAGSQKGFAPKLRRHGLRQVFRWVHGRSVRAWEGIELVRPKGHHDD